MPVELKALPFTPRQRRRSSLVLHGWEQELAIAVAGLPRASDDALAAAVRVRFRTAHEAAITERLEAQRLAASLGRGRHVLPNGQRVTVIIQSSGTTVRVRGVGFTKTVTWHKTEPVIKVQRTRGFQHQVLEKNAADVSYRTRNENEPAYREARYRLQKDGTVVQLISTPFSAAETIAV